MAIQVAGTTIIDDSRQLIDAILVGYSEKYIDLGNSGSSKTIDLSQGSILRVRLTANCTFAFSTNKTSTSFTLIVENDTISGRSITWPASVRWPNSTIPPRTTTANRKDFWVFTTVDGGTTWYGNLALYNFT